MSKTLAGILAVSIAALLFAGCGGSSSSPSEASTTTTQIESDLCRQLNEEFDLAYNGALQGITDLLDETENFRNFDQKVGALTEPQLAKLDEILKKLRGAGCE